MYPVVGGLRFILELKSGDKMGQAVQGRDPKSSSSKFILGLAGEGSPTEAVKGTLRH